jgi:DNA-binding MarR family transcriptional regulator
MLSEVAAPLVRCNCLALRQAARHVTQFYDERLAPTGLRATQFSILAKLDRPGAVTINALARELVMDRTTLGRTMLPLEREGLISVSDGRVDRRSKELALTRAGARRLRAAARLWGLAQREFERCFGVGRARDLRTLLAEVVSCRLDAGPQTSSSTRGGANA